MSNWLARLYTFYEFVRHFLMPDNERRASIRASYLRVMADPSVSYEAKQHLRELVLPILERKD